MVPLPTGAFSVIRYISGIIAPVPSTKEYLPKAHVGIREEQQKVKQFPK